MGKAIWLAYIILEQRKKIKAQDSIRSTSNLVLSKLKTKYVCFDLKTRVIYSFILYLDNFDVLGIYL